MHDELGVELKRKGGKDQVHDDDDDDDVVGVLNSVEKD